MEYKLHGFKEVVFSVRNLEADTQMYTSLGGWEVIDKTELARNQLDFWKLPTNAVAHSNLLKYPGRDFGLLRLVSFQNVPQKHIRSNSQSWDTGGIYDVDLRVADIEQKIEDFQSYGWTGFCDYEEYHFNQFHVSEILMKGSEDIVFALIQRHAPTLVGFPLLKEMSHIFNSSQIVRDINISKEFFLDKLGWQVYMENISENSPAGPNVFGIPHNIYPNTRRHIQILSPDGNNEGSVELVEIEGLEGRDFTNQCAPPNLGILMLRYPVENIAAYKDRLISKGVEIINHAKGINLSPYGKAEIMSIQTPDGAWMEFYELED